MCSWSAGELTPSLNRIPILLGIPGRIRPALYSQMKKHVFVCGDATYSMPCSLSVCVFRFGGFSTAVGGW